ncbi:unnamed protein product [Brassica napus]|uniref:(rape) hypothetical protein n=1 Tax=Brassica napus TaxID=3708 RepID=A0A816VHY3_BRANA|nr:unnamed protein product [Brassica napus]
MLVTSSPTLQGGLVRTKLPFRSVEICADGFTVTFPIPPIGENLSLSVFGEAMEPLFLSLYEASGGLLFVLPLCLTNQCWCFSVQRQLFGGGTTSISRREKL